MNLHPSTPEDDICPALMRDGKSEKCESFRMLEPGNVPPAKKARKDGNRVKQSATTNPEEALEYLVWKDFPEDLFEAVMARLPVTTFFRFRSVCQKWNSLLMSQSFSQQCAQLPLSKPWIYTISHEKLSTGAMYDPTSKKWHRSAVSASPSKVSVFPVTSAGGLVCFLDIGQQSFYICNPLSRSFKELPPRSVKVQSRVAVGMTLNEFSATSGDYKIVYVCYDGEYEVYDSKQNSWICPGSMPSSIKLPLSLNFRSQAVCIDGVLHFMRREPDGIVCYNMVTGVWKQLLIPAPLHLSDYTLAEFEGRIMLVGLLTKNHVTCVCIWELQKMTLLWKEVDRMPNLWCLEFYGKHVWMTCLGNKGLLMLLLRSIEMNCLVTYDVSTREWLKVPSCHGMKQQWIACGVAFHPCLTALV